MRQSISIYNSLTRKKEAFLPLQPPKVGLYVCGPTVYGHPHLGHARPAVTYDVLYRYLGACGYKVRYVRNITDVGHLENDADEGEDKIAKKAKLEEIEPMEVAHYYTESYHKAMRLLNAKSPSIEPRASGHILEQIELVKKIIDSGYAYEAAGSVYFNVEKYNSHHCYGALSGRRVEDLLSNTRQLEGQSEKLSPLDFALWKKAKPEHIMRWPSPWSQGFPGWHLECTAMSTKYLGEEFDIHGGGLDLLFPHHECEIAQSVASTGKESVRYWMHNNMITINGQKMGKSLGNFITLDELFTGQHHLLEKAYSPLAVRFFILMAHYRSTLDFSNEALSAAEKGLARLLAGISAAPKIKPSAASDADVQRLMESCYQALDDDMNTPILIAKLFEASSLANSAAAGTKKLTQEDILKLQELFQLFAFDILGLQEAQSGAAQAEAFAGAVDLLMEVRQQAKQNKDWATSDKIRDQLAALGFSVKDKKDGCEWSL
jgi:cysteinyl-tRNA synthetase